VDVYREIKDRHGLLQQLQQSFIVPSVLFNFVTVVIGCDQQDSHLQSAMYMKIKQLEAEMSMKKSPSADRSIFCKSSMEIIPMRPCITFESCASVWFFKNSREFCFCQQPPRTSSLWWQGAAAAVVAAMVTVK
jgi:hypothetical protein